MATLIQHPLALTFATAPDMRRGNWLQTFTGRAYWPEDPHPDDVFLEDIAHALSMLCRYGGHCSEFYSVAEHSVLVSHLVPREDALHALMHDATEAYVVDLPRPIKKCHLLRQGYAVLEDRNWIAIARRFKLDRGHVPYMPHSVHQADTDILLLEKQRLLGESPCGDWLGEDHRVVYDRFPEGIEITCAPPKVAKLMFLQRYFELTGEKA